MLRRRLEGRGNERDSASATQRGLTATQSCTPTAMSAAKWTLVKLAI
jgi:hypothetical protein